MASLPISGAECVAALRLAGFRVVQRHGGGTVLVRRGRLVVVPDALVLSTDVLDAVLDDVDLSHERFLWLLAEAATQPDVPVLAPGAP